MTMSVVQVGLILIGTFFLLLALSVPVSISLIVSSVLTTACVMDLDLATFVASQKMITGVDSFSLIAVPFFILCGVLMNSGGIAQKLINFAKLFVGFIPGGLYSRRPCPHQYPGQHPVRLHIRLIRGSIHCRGRRDDSPGGKRRI